MRSERTITQFRCDSCDQVVEVDGAQTAAPEGWAFAAVQVAGKADDLKTATSTGLYCSEACILAAVRLKADVWNVNRDSVAA